MWYDYRVNTGHPHDSQLRLGSQDSPTGVGEEQYRYWHSSSGTCSCLGRSWSPWYVVNKCDRGASKNSLSCKILLFTTNLMNYEDRELEHFVASNFIEEMLDQETLDEIEYYDDQTFGDLLNSSNDF